MMTRERACEDVGEGKASCLSHIFGPPLSTEDDLRCVGGGLDILKCHYKTAAWCWHVRARVLCVWRLGDWAVLCQGKSILWCIGGLEQRCGITYYVAGECCMKKQALEN